MKTEKIKKFLNTAIVTKQRNDEYKTKFMVFNEETEFKHHWKEIKEILFKSDFRTNDFHYETLSEAFSSILSHLEDGKELNEFEVDDYLILEPYMHILLQWLQDDLYNISYLEKIIQKTKCKDFVVLLQYSYECAKSDVYQMAISVVEYLREVSS